MRMRWPLPSTCSRRSTATAATPCAAAEKLAKMATEEEKIAYWKTAGKTMTNARDDTADLETTALAAYALPSPGATAA